MNMNSNYERNVDPIQEMKRVIESSSKLQAWGFKEDFQSTKSNELIYNSEWCRISFVWGGWDLLGGNTISIYYGRLHAPNESSTMIINGEECHAWHDFKLALHFLDGRSPNETSKVGSSHWLTDKYYEDEYRKKFHRRQPEWLMQMHMDVWDHYGERFFELFDIRRPDTWEQYRVFLKEYYDIKGRRRSIAPPRDKVC